MDLTGKFGEVAQGYFQGLNSSELDHGNLKREGVFTSVHAPPSPGPGSTHRSTMIIAIFTSLTQSTVSWFKISHKLHTKSGDTLTSIFFSKCFQEVD